MLLEQFKGFYRTPPLWKARQFGVYQFDFPRLSFEGFSPKRIPENLRLGHQTEHIFEQLITHEGSYQLMMQNQPIRVQKNTIGEIDFILKRIRTGGFYHVELTYKFYIVDPTISEPVHRLMGPNRRDMFFTKLEKIKNEQLPLVQNQETINILDKNGIKPEFLTQQVCFKAQIFRPYAEKTVHIRPLDPKCVVGYWLRFEEFERSGFEPLQFYIPFKKEWAIAPHLDVTWKSHWETCMEINLRMIQKNAPMVWVRKANDVLEKCFVVWW